MHHFGSIPTRPLNKDTLFLSDLKFGDKTINLYDLQEGELRNFNHFDYINLEDYLPNDLSNIIRGYCGSILTSIVAQIVRNVCKFNDPYNYVMSFKNINIVIFFISVIMKKCCVITIVIKNCLPCCFNDIRIDSFNFIIKSYLITDFYINIK